MNDFLVTLYKSDNTYLTYPVNGKITILETGTDGRIIRAVFQKDNGGPVVIDHPDFEYPAEQRARWFSEYGEDAAIAQAVKAEREMAQRNADEMITISRDMLNSEIASAVAAAIAAAVQAEREACAQTVETFDNNGEPIGKRDIAAAIRARNGAGRK